MSLEFTMFRIATVSLAVALAVVVVGCAQAKDMAKDDVNAAADAANAEANAAAAEVDAATTPDIIDTAVAAGSFNTLAAALTAADLITTLKGEGPFTVFAPTDDAFKKIPAGDLEALLADKEKLTAVLMLHVVPGKVMAKDVVALGDGAMVKTAGGAEVQIGVATAGVTVNGSTVSKTDIVAKNGVIHVVDSVIMPK